MAKTTKAKGKTGKKSGKQLQKVPSEYVFWCNDGKIFSDIFELAEGLTAMSDETFAYHSNLEKHDFSNWVRDIIGDEELANELACAVDRLRAADCVVARITLLTGK
jgi:hypothetical protein